MAPQSADSRRLSGPPRRGGRLPSSSECLVWDPFADRCALRQYCWTVGEKKQGMIHRVQQCITAPGPGPGAPAESPRFRGVGMGCCGAPMPAGTRRHRR